MNEENSKNVEYVQIKKSTFNLFKFITLMNIIGLTAMLAIHILQAVRPDIHIPSADV